MAYSAKGFDVTELERAIKDLKKKTDPETAQSILLEAGFILEGHIKTTLANGDRSGRVYIIQGRRHVASAPGEPPAVETGYLLGSIFTKAVDRYKVMVGTDAEYAVFLEYGTSRMAARPFMSPTFDKAVGEIVEFMGNRIAEELAA